MSSQEQFQTDVELEEAIKDSMSDGGSGRSERSVEDLLGRPSTSALAVNLGPYGGLVEATHPYVDLQQMEYRKRGGCPDQSCEGLFTAPLYDRSSPQGGLVSRLPGRQTPTATEADYIVGSGRCECCGPSE